MQHNNRHSGQGNSKDQKWYDMNMVTIRESRIPFEQRQSVLLFRVEGMPIVDFYPHTGRWRVAGQTKTYTGGASAFLNWYQREGTRNISTRLERLRTAAAMHAPRALGQPCNCNTCYLLAEVDAQGKDLVSTLLIRPEVLAFAARMELVLRRHDGVKGSSWKDLDDGELMDLLRTEVIELDQAVDHAAMDSIHRDIPARTTEDAAIVNEAADVANFAMMIAIKHGLV